MAILAVAAIENTLNTITTIKPLKTAFISNSQPTSASLKAYCWCQHQCTLKQLCPLPCEPAAGRCNRPQHSWSAPQWCHIWAAHGSRLQPLCGRPRSLHKQSATDGVERTKDLWEHVNCTNQQLERSLSLLLSAPSWKDSKHQLVQMKDQLHFAQRNVNIIKKQRT